MHRGYCDIIAVTGMLVAPLGYFRTLRDITAYTITVPRLPLYFETAVISPRLLCDTAALTLIFTTVTEILP